MSDNINLSIGERIEVLSYNNNRQQISYSFIQDLLSGNQFIVNLPLLNSKPILVHIGETIKINFFRKNGQYCFSAKVLDLYKSSETYLVKVEKMSSVVRTQRRNFYRFKTTIPVIIKLHKLNQSNDILCIKAYTVDISGGGMRVISNIYLQPGIKIDCSILLNKADAINVAGKVLRSIKTINEDYDKKMYESAICYFDISEHARDTIIRYIFSEQMKLKKNDLI